MIMRRAFFRSASANPSSRMRAAVRTAAKLANSCSPDVTTFSPVAGSTRQSSQTSLIATAAPDAYAARKNPAALICATMSEPSGVITKSWAVSGTMLASVPPVVSAS